MGKKIGTKSEKDQTDLDSLKLGLMDKDQIDEEIARLNLEIRKQQLELLKAQVRTANANANYAESEAKIRAREV